MPSDETFVCPACKRSYVGVTGVADLCPYCGEHIENPTSLPAPEAPDSVVS